MKENTAKYENFKIFFRPFFHYFSRWRQNWTKKITATKKWAAIADFQIGQHEDQIGRPPGNVVRWESENWAWDLDLT